MYSQHNEEQIIKDFFKNSTGRYLDIGAFDGVISSNTLALAENGWSGIAVEPNLTTFEHLTRNYAARNLQNIQLINAAYVPESFANSVDYFEIAHSIGTGWGSLSQNHILYSERWKDRKADLQTQIVKTIKPSQLFANDKNFKFISIDVESFNLEVLVTLPWDQLNDLELVCVEMDTNRDRFITFMKNVNFSFLTSAGSNLFFRKNKNT